MNGTFTMWHAVLHLINMMSFYLVIFFMLYDTALFIRQRRTYRYVTAILMTAFDYVVFQGVIQTDFGNIFIKTELTGIRIFAGIYIALSATVAVLLYIDASRWSKNNVSPNSIKESFDTHPSAICFFYGNGKIAMVNQKMDELFYSMTGKKIISGNLMWDCISGGEYISGFTLLKSEDYKIILAPDGTVYRFRKREIPNSKKTMFEVSGTDITEIYYKTIELDENNHRIEAANRNIRNYTEHISEFIKEKEILKTKSEIHDGMNMVLLNSKRLLEAGTPEEREKILLRWKANALMLCKEAHSEGITAFEKLNKIASELGLYLEIRGKSYEETQEQLRVLSDAGKEFVINTAKHSDAAKVIITKSDYDGRLTHEYSHDGRSLHSFECEGGGLMQIRKEAENLGGIMTVTDDGDGFRMKISFKPGKEAD